MWFSCGFVVGWVFGLFMVVYLFVLGLFTDAGLLLCVVSDLYDVLCVLCFGLIVAWVCCVTFVSCCWGVWCV